MTDRSAYDDFVVHHSQALLRSAFYLTGDRALAEDLLQTALVKAWFAWGRIEHDPQAYVRRIMATTSTSWWRRKWRGETPHGPDELPEPGSGGAGAGADAAGAVDRREDLWPALRRLPARQRAVVVLRFIEDLTEQQTADALGCSVGTVKSQASKALAKLRLDPGLAGYGAAASTGSSPTSSSASSPTSSSTSSPTSTPASTIESEVLP